MANVDIGTLQVRVEARVDALTKNLSVLTRNTTRAILNRLAQSTPADTSEAVSNWQVSLNGPPSQRLEPYYPGVGGSTKQASARAMLLTARAIIPQFYVAKGQTLYLGNTAPYIKRLNDGYSKQAPKGFVEAAVLAGSEYIRSAAPIISGKYNDDVS